MIRAPAVAGQIYPTGVDEVNADLDELLSPTVAPRRVAALVVPHAGWLYSGRTAGITYAGGRFRIG